MAELVIRRATPQDAERVAAIYNSYVLSEITTFETEPVTDADMSRRIEQALTEHDWIVGEQNGRLVGYAYYVAFRARAAYRHTVESTVYLSDEHVGKGFGRALYSALTQSATARGFQEMIGVIALPNPASVALHEKLGFRRVGVLHRVGYKFDRHADVGLWQLSLLAGNK